MTLLMKMAVIMSTVSLSFLTGAGTKPGACILSASLSNVRRWLCHSILQARSLQTRVLTVRAHTVHYSDNIRFKGLSA